MYKMNKANNKSDEMSLLAKHNAALLHSYLKEATHALESGSRFRDDMFISNICNDNLLPLIQSYSDVLDSKILATLLTKAKKRIIAIHKSIINDVIHESGLDHIKVLLDKAHHILSTNKTLPAKQTKIHVDAAIVVKTYKDAISSGISKKSVVEVLQDSMVNNWITYLSTKNKKIVIDKLKIVYPLWHISHNTSYTYARLEFLTQPFQTSNEAELAFHEILAKLVKTATEQQLLGTLYHLCKGHDNDTLDAVVQHANLPLLKKTMALLKPSHQAQVEAAQKHVISSRAADIYRSDHISHVTIDQILQHYRLKQLNNEQDRSITDLIYQFCSNRPSNDDIKQLYIFAFTECESLIQTLLTHSLAAQLEVAYDGLVLRTLFAAKQRDDTAQMPLPVSAAISLGQMIYNEIKYRIDHGMSLPIYAGDASQIAKLWQERFMYFDNILGALQDRIIDTALQIVRDYDQKR